MKKVPNYIDHVALVLDASGSMNRHCQTLPKVADQLVAHLARKSKELNRETRVTIYGFDEKVRCLVFDMDVLRLPSIADLYWIGGMTALLDATAQSIQDLRRTAQMYGDHAFLTYVLTDGAENASMSLNRAQMRAMLTNMYDNETIAVLVPNEAGVHYAKECGFPEGNITIWEVSTREGLEEAATKITRSVDAYMAGRTTGLRKSTSLFSTGLDTVNKKTVNSKTMVALARDSYFLLDIDEAAPIREWILAKGYNFQIGKAFYQLVKPEMIQKQKAIALQNKHSGRIYTGPQARDLLGLTELDVRVKPSDNPEYRIFVQSTSVNRKLVPGTKLLLLN